MRDIVHESMASRERRAGIQRSEWIGFDQFITGRAGHDDLRETVFAGNEVAIEIRGQQGNAVDVGIAQANAQQIEGLRLDFSPGRRAAGRTFQHLAGCLRLTINQSVFAQEDLVGFM